MNNILNMDIIGYGLQKKNNDNKACARESIVAAMES